jgi:diaminopimelate epimerase
MPSETGDFRMRMFNLDGSEGKMCGNASRCVGKYVYERGLTDKTLVALETLGGMKYLDLHVEDGIVKSVTVDMGEPILEAAEIPVVSEKSPVIGEKVQILDKEFEYTCVSMGNPHAVTFVDSVKEFPLETYGKVSECHPMFPERVNTEIVEVIDDSHVKMRVWERGSGETWACGTGACATAVACHLNGKTGRTVEVELVGGTLIIEWREADNHVYMTGPAEFSFDGVWLQEV